MLDFETGKSKFSDTEITGIINAISGTIGGLSLEGKKLFSQNHKLQIDGEEANTLTFMLYEQIDAFRSASQNIGLSKEDIEDVFYNNAKKIIDILKSKGYTLVLATNPVFPKVATYQRVKWAGLEVSDFSYITTYENSSFCKPSLEYYQEVLEKINKKPGDCMMIGNNVTEDMVISKLGIKAFLLTENLINQENSDINRFRHGGWNELINLVDELPSLK